MIVLPPGVGESLGLGPHFQIAPMSWIWQRLDMNTTDGPMRVDLLVIEDVYGRRGYGLVGEDAAAFAAGAVEATSGLTVAREIPRSDRDN